MQRTATILVCLASCLPYTAQAGSEAPPPATVMNFRDVGGTPLAGGSCVRRGLIFRSGNFDSTTAADGAALVKTYHLSTYYDLRSLKEGSQKGPKALVDAGVRWQHLPMDSGDDGLFGIRRPDATRWLTFYTRSFERHAAVYVQLLTKLSEEKSAVVYGCTLGKDRTGISTALLLSALGAGDDAIADDYVETTARLRDRVDLMMPSLQKWGFSQEDYLVGWAAAHREVIEGFLDYLRKTYGSAEKALLAKGLTPAALAKLKQRLQAPAAECKKAA